MGQLKGAKMEENWYTRWVYEDKTQDYIICKVCMKVIDREYPNLASTEGAKKHGWNRSEYSPEEDKLVKCHVCEKLSKWGGRLGWITQSDT
jgi:Fe2+ or Zn2+ uptake regulation protein